MSSSTAAQPDHPVPGVPPVPTTPPAPGHAEVRVDLDAIADNVTTLRAMAPGSALMAVVKADAYGHGLLPVARAARAGGAGWLGTAVLAEALAVRAAGDRGPLLAWLTAPGERFDLAVDADVDLGVSAPWALTEIAAAARSTGRRARVHVKVDTGLGRGGSTMADLAELLGLVRSAQDAGGVELVGLWSHLALADDPGHPTIQAQLDVFGRAVALADDLGLEVPVRHLANSAATLSLPAAHLDLVRPGLAVYGLSPLASDPDPATFGLRPAMSVRARLALVKRVPAGHGVSYGHEYVTSAETTLGLVPLGYADGVPRHGGGSAGRPGAPVLAAGRRRGVAGRVCMDQLVLDLGDDLAAAGDEVVLIGDARHGEPTAQDWAEHAGTISYEIVTRMAPRLPRRYVGTAGR